MEVPLSFLTVTGKYFVIFFISVHYGVCCWYYLLRMQPESDGLWRASMQKQMEEQILGEDPDKRGSWYFTGVYFTIVALISCSSWLPPSSNPEKSLALILHVFGWIISSLTISGLSAWLVDVQARQSARRRAEETLKD